MAHPLSATISLMRADKKPSRPAPEERGNDVSLGALTSALYYYLSTSLVVFSGVIFGHHYLEHQAYRLPDKGSLANAFASWDGYWYRQIAVNGYSYSPDSQSSVAFFPAYPLIASTLVRLTGLSPDLALLLVSHLCLAATFVLMAVYVTHRYTTAPRWLSHYCLLALGFAPASLFFRMAYTESLFIFLALLASYAIERKWPLFVIALFVGLLTATRPVGIGFLLPFLLHVWHRSHSMRTCVLNVAFLLPLACWGIAGYMLYQGLQFGDPLAFIKTQIHWRTRFPAPSTFKLVALLTYEPIWSVYDPMSPVYWGFQDSLSHPLFSWVLLNPIYFVTTVLILMAGAYKRWLSLHEIVLAFALLAIGYLAKGYDMGMGSQARFAAVVFPVYLVIGNFLARIPAPMATVVLGVSSCFLGIYSALFATWHMVF